jgi:mono/diheme cytochrome c family protein
MSVPVLLVAMLALCACANDTSYEPEVPQGDPRRGRAALADFECGVCHAIPGVAGANGTVGPPLDSMRRNVYIAGKFPNTPDTLVRFIIDAPELAPETAMPNMGVAEQQARDMAAYLYSVD